MSYDRFEGRVSERHTHIPAREGRAVEIEAGRSFRVIDIHGGQVADLFAFCVDDMSEHLSAEHTRAQIYRLFPLVGESFVTNRRRPILAFEVDASPGRHDMLFAACDAARYASFGASADHASCAQNLRGAIAAHDLEHLRVPQPVNLFENVSVRPNGTLDWEPPTTKAGDYVQLRAEQDCVVVVCACPYDLSPSTSVGPLAVDLL